MENKNKEDEVILSVSRKDGDWIASFSKENSFNELLYSFVTLGVYLEHCFGKEGKELILEVMRKCTPEGLAAVREEDPKE